MTELSQFRAYVAKATGKVVDDAQLAAALHAARKQQKAKGDRYQILPIYREDAGDDWHGSRGIKYHVLVNNRAVDTFDTKREAEEAIRYYREMDRKDPNWNKSYQPKSVLTKSLTDKQRDILMRLDIVRDQTAERIRQNDPPFNVPTDWVFGETMRQRFGVTQPQLDRLVSMGYLEQRPSGGSGSQYRRVRKDYQPKSVLAKALTDEGFDSAAVLRGLPRFIPADRSAIGKLLQGAGIDRETARTVAGQVVVTKYNRYWQLEYFSIPGQRLIIHNIRESEAVAIQQARQVAADPNFKDVRLTRVTDPSQGERGRSKIKPVSFKSLPSGTVKALDSQGGEEPVVSSDQLKAADFITLPKAVEGTNCSNCLYQKGGICTHEKLDGQSVNEHNCCGYWDNPEALREWQQQEKQYWVYDKAAIRRMMLPVVEKKVGPFSYQSTQLDIPEGLPGGQEVTVALLKKLIAGIAEEDLAGDGREPDTHITVKYGLLPEVTADTVAELLQGFGPVQVKLGPTAAFTNQDDVTQRGGDGTEVVYVSVESPDLVRLNVLLSEELPHIDSHPGYVPHITLAYVKPGAGKRYVDNFDVAGDVLTFAVLTFSDQDGVKTSIDLGSPGVQEKGAGGICTPGHTAARDGCTPASEASGKKPSGTSDQGSKKPTSARPAEPGKFTKPAASRGQMVGAKRVGKGKDAKIVLANGKPAPSHIKPSMVPPDWTGVQVSLDPNSDLLVTAKDNKGRGKCVYADNFHTRNAAIKFARVSEMIAKGPAVDKEIQAARKDPAKKESADCAWLMSVQATRPGSDSDTGGRVRAYGATTLEGRHVVQTKDGVRLRFIGKEGVAHDHLIRDPALGKMLLERSKKAGKNGRLFATSAGKVNTFIGTLDGGHFSAKDFRTRRANLLAADLIKQLGPPKDGKEYKAKVKQVAEQVSVVLGNRPQQALESYINPAVFASWQTVTTSK